MTSRSIWAKRVTLFMGVTVGILGLTVLGGWHLHLVSLIQVLPTLAPMQRMAALGFVMIGAALVSAAMGHRVLTVVCTLIVGIESILVCLEYALDISLGVDQLMGPDYINVHTSNLGRMSPVTALCFIGSCAAVLAIANSGLRRPASAMGGILASVLVAVGTVSVLGYLLGHTETYGWSHLTRMALHTSAGFVLIGFALLAWAWQESPMKKDVPDWLPLSIGLGLAAGVLGVWQGLMAHQESDVPLLSGIILVGGLLGSFLVAIAIAQTLQARRRSRQLQESKDVLEHVFEAPLDALMLIDRQGRVVRVNHRIEAIFGYRPEEVSGMAIETLVPEKLRERHRAHREGYYASPTVRSMGERLDLYALRKDGSQFPVEVSLGPVESAGETHVLAVVRDITDRKQAQEALRLSEERFRSIFEQGPLGITLIGPDYRMIRVNPRFGQMLSYSEEELARMTPLDITHPGDLDPSINILEHLFTGDATIRKIDKRYLKKNGEIMWGSLSVSAVCDRKGRPVYGLGMLEDITDRKQTEHKLREQAALLNLAQDAILVRDLGSGITFWNRGAEETYGWSAEEAMGCITHNLLQTKFPVPLREIEELLNLQGHWEGELEHTSRDGRTIIAASRWSLQRDERGAPIAILEINRDITLRKRSEEQSRNLAERLSLATRTASIGIWDWDLRTNHTVWDDTTFAMCGLPKVVPMPIEEFNRRVHPEDAAAVEASLRRAIQGKTQDFVEFRIIRPDGTVRYLSSAEGVVLDEHGDVVRVVGTAVDITERKQMEAQIESSREQMAVSARLSALGMMAGGVAHEINNPLAVIHASAGDLLRKFKQEEAVPVAFAVRKCERILETANRIQLIVKSMRHVAREGSRDRVLPASVSHIVEATLALCQEHIKHHSVNLILPHIDPGLFVPCREVQIAQVLMNLLQNAFDAVMEQPGEKWIRLDVAVDDSAVVFSVTDNGPGVPPDLQTKIMEPFFTTKDVGKGTGLGLSISRAMVEEHGGKLEFKQKAGHPCFWFRLPLAQKEAVVCN